MPPPDSSHQDPFKEARAKDGTLQCPFHGEDITMLLRHGDVRKAARDWQTYSSDAPMRVVIPSEEKIRSIRQLPIEVDPPDHTEYRAIVEPFFQRPKTPEMIAAIEALVERMVDDALASGEIEAVHEFALPLQSRALTHLLNVPENEADIWIDWGVHVFRDADGEFKKENKLDAYLIARFDQAAQNPGEDLFSALLQSEFRGRKLTREECVGFANLAFAGGRDTIIHSLTAVLAYLAKHPESLIHLREDPKRIKLATEELFRVFMPLTQIGRVCPADTDVQDIPVKAGKRIGLCWASANYDETVFAEPEEIKLDRKPNPHVSFGFGNHLCLGAPHARLLVRTLLQTLAAKVERLEILDAEENVEREVHYNRTVGFKSLHLRLHGRVE
jgi:cytochrome P450